METISKKVPRLRFREFTKDWVEDCLGKRVKFARGNLLSKSDINPMGQYECIHYGELFTDYSEVIKHVNSHTDLDTGVNSHIGDILMPTSDVTPQGLAKASSIERDGVKIGGDINVLRPSNGTSSVFLSYLLNAQKKKILRLVTGTTVRHVYSKDLSKSKYCFPIDEVEQEKIAGFLTTVDDKIFALQKKKEAVDKYKKGMMQAIFSQKIRFNDENEKEYPAWRKVALNNLEDEQKIKLGRGNVISKIDILSTPGNYPIYSSSIHNGGLFGKYGKYMFDEELITWSVDGGGNFFYRPKGRFSVTNVSGWLKVRDTSTLNSRFLAYQLQFLHGRQVFDYQSKAHPSVIRSIYKLMLPSVTEQHKIADFLTAIDDKINLTERELEQARQFKKALLQQMFI